MATATTNIETQSYDLLHKAANFFSAIGTALVRVGEANSRFQEVERLNRKSDEQLVELGIKREDVSRHVYRDLFYI